MLWILLLFHPPLMRTSLNYTRCQRSDGSYYGTGGTCRKGREVDPELMKKLLGTWDKISSSERDEMMEGVAVLGEGMYGKVYDAGNGVVVKVGQVSEEELYVMEELNAVDGVPRVVAENVSEGGNVLGMTKALGKPIGDYLDEGYHPSIYADAMEEALPVIKEIHNNNIIHNDLHTRNILYDRDTRTSTVIDFGLAQSTSPKQVMNEVFTLHETIKEYLEELEESAPISADEFLNSETSNIGALHYNVNKVKTDMETKGITSKNIKQNDAKRYVEMLWADIMK